MAIFEIQGPDGSVYEVDAPDERAAVSGFQKFNGSPSTSQSQPYSGSILPMSRDAQGHVSFDSNAGILGMAKRALGGVASAATLPGDVFTGKTSMIGPDGHTNPEVIGRAAELASLATPVNPAIRAGDRIIPGVGKNLVREQPKVPTTEELAAAGRGDIAAASNSGWEIAHASGTHLPFCRINVSPVCGFVAVAPS